MATITIDIKNEINSQEISIPQAMRIDDDKVYIKQIGNSLFIIPFHNPWQNLIEATAAFTPDFMEQRNQEVNQTRELFD